MEVDGQQSTASIHTFCKPCGDGYKRVHVPANGLCRECEEHMCIACFGTHKKYKMCKDHNLVDIDTQISDVSDTNESFERCQQHSNEHIKFYCSSHEDVGCGDCMILGHKTCTIRYIRDVSESYKHSEDYNNIIKKVDSFQTEIQKCSASINGCKIQADEDHQRFIVEINSFRSEINALLDKLENELVQKANDAKVTDILLTESLETSCQELEKQLSQINDDIVSKSDETNKLFVTIIRGKHALKGIGHKLCSIITENKITSYRFKENYKIKALLEQAELGHMHVLNEIYGSEQNSQDYEQPISLQTDLAKRNAVSIEEITTTMHDSQAEPGMRPTQYGNNTAVQPFQTERDTTHTMCEQNTPVPNSQVDPRPRYSIYENSTSVIDLQENDERVYDEIPDSNIKRNLGSSRRKHWSLFENQLRCENLLMAGECLSFKDNGSGDIGMFIGKRAIKAGTYLEVDVISSGSQGNIAIGFKPKDYSLKEQPGDGPFSTGYHTRDGCIHDQSKQCQRISSPCKAGDVIGFGVSSYLNNVFKTKIGVFFTRNRQKIGELEINNPPFCKVYPTVSLQCSGDKARVILDAKVP